MENAKKTNRIFLFVVVLFCLCVVAFWANQCWTHRKKTHQNVANSQKIKIGHRIDDVIAIMGQADEQSIRPINSLVGEERKCLYYEPPFEASDGIYIFLDTDVDTVVYIIHYSL